MAYGTVNTDIVADSSGGRLAPISSVFRNRIINGAMVLDQRNAGASVTPTNGQYLVDRWKAALTQSSKFSVQQNAGAITPPAGFKNYLGVTSLSSYSIGSGDIFGIIQSIEGYNIADLGWGTANAKTVTLSFQVYSSLTGTFGGVIQNDAQTYSYPFSYSIPVANTWTSISITIAGQTSGVWGSTNTTGLLMNFGLGVGSTYSATANTWASGNYFSATGATSVVGTNGATFYITGVQLEVGSSATGYEYRQYGQELALCQRYYYVTSSCPALIANSTLTQAIVKFAVEMRTSPSASYTSGLYAYNPIASNQAITSISAIPAQQNSTSSCVFSTTTGGMSSISAGMANFIYQSVAGTGSFNFSAEL